jgi:ATP-binding cassette subfamily B protein
VRLLWRFHLRFWRHRRALLLGILCVPLAVFFDIRITLEVAKALDRLRADPDTAFLPGFFLLLVGYASAQGVFRFFHRWWIVGVSRRFEVELKQDLFDRLVRLSFGFHNRSRSGDVVSRVTSDVENLRMLLGPGLMYVLGALVMVPGSLVVLASKAPSLTLSMTVPLLCVALFMWALTPRLHRHSSAVQVAIGELAQRAQESFMGQRVVKAYGIASHEEQAVALHSACIRDQQVQLARARGLVDALSELAKDLSLLPILFVGGWAMIDRTIQAGDLFAFIDLNQKIFWPLMALGWMAGLWPRALASAERVQALLDERSEIEDAAAPVRLERPRGELELEEVGFTYPHSDRPALSGISLCIPAGTTLGIVGPTGSGKSTLLNLVGRLFEAQGEIRLDGVPIRGIALSDLRAALAFVPQDGFLFSDTYRENVGFGVDERVGDQRLASLIDSVGMSAEVAAFPGRFDQLVGERGVTLSGGQRQRTCIARALARDPRVLLLDDALSAVDTETEAHLLARLGEERRKRTVLVAAHRLATIRDAEQVLVLKDGRMEAIGRHHELLERSPWYRSTWERQRMRAELLQL